MSNQNKIHIKIAQQGNALEPASLARWSLTLGVKRGTVFIERIFISPARGVPQVEYDRITVHAGLGPVGDRNYGVSAHPGQSLTLVEAEEIERFCAQYNKVTDLSVTRRNLVTRGVRLNDLLNAEFTIGGVKLRGIELCEPCLILGNNLGTESLAAAVVVKHWVGRGGLRVDVLTSGEIVRGASLQTVA